MIAKIILGFFALLLASLLGLAVVACIDEQDQMQSCRDRGGVPIIQRGVFGVGCVPGLPGGTP